MGQVQQKSHQARTCQGKDSVVPLLLFVRYFVFMEDSRVLYNNSKNHGYLRACFFEGSSFVVKHLRRGQRISLFTWFLRATWGRKY